MLTAAATLLLALAQAAPPPPGGDAELEAELAALLPRPEEERFAAIPWQHALMAARALAAEARRPLFLWIMNGHPFGCT